MTRRYFSSAAAATTLSSSITSGATSLTVGATTGFPSSFPYTLILDPGTASEEVITVTAGAGTTLTVTRGSDGTTGLAHTSGAVVKHGVSARDFDEPNAHVNASADVHGLSGGAAVVGTTTAQTLTNKTVALGSNTVSGTKAQFNTAITDADMATLDGAETLTNKTLALGSNTVSGTLAQLQTAITDDDVLGLAATAWASYTPTLTNGTVGNGTIAGRYSQIGKTVTFTAKFVLGSTSAIATGLAISLPVTAKSGAPLSIIGGIAYDVSLNTLKWIGAEPSTTTVTPYVNDGGVVAPNSPFTWAAGDSVEVSGTYEAA